MDTPQRIHDLAHIIASEVNKLGEYEHGRRCIDCKGCLYNLEKYIDELILMSMWNKEE